MKMKDWPTLAEFQNLLGKTLYVDFVWMWRENMQDSRAAERRAALPEIIPLGNVQTWPTPAFAQATVPVSPAPAQVALLRARSSGGAVVIGDTAESAGGRELMAKGLRVVG